MLLKSMFISKHSILDWASFCMNYCINVAWYGGNQPVALLMCNGSPGCFDSGLQVICIVGSRVSHLPLDNSGQASLLANQARCQVLLENEISISRRRKHEVLWYMAALTVDFRKHSGPTPADDMAAQIITDCGNFTLDFKQRGLCASPLFLQTLGH